MRRRQSRKASREARYLTYADVRPDNSLIHNYQSFFFEAPMYFHRGLKVLEHSNMYVESYCGVPNKGNVAFAFSFVSPQFMLVSVPPRHHRFP